MEVHARAADLHVLLRVFEYLSLNITIVKMQFPHISHEKIKLPGMAFFSAYLE